MSKETCSVTFTFTETGEEDVVNFSQQFEGSTTGAVRLADLILTESYFKYFFQPSPGVAIMRKRASGEDVGALDEQIVTSMLEDFHTATPSYVEEDA